MKFTLLILALIAPLLLLGSAGGALHPIGDSLAVFRFHIALVALFSAYVLFRLFYPRLALVIVVLSLAASGAIVNSYRSHHMHNLDYVLYQKNLSFRLENPQPVISDIQFLNPHFITLQEVTQRNQLVLKGLETSHPTQLHCKFGRVGGVALASRFPAVKDSAFCSEKKGLAAIQVTTPDGPVWLVSIHLHWPFPFHQASHVQNLLPELSALTGPVVLAGDFNMVPWSYTMTQIETATRTTRVGKTNGTFLLEGMIMIPIDHVLAPSNCAGENSTLDLLGSDHHGVLARFSLQRC